MIIMSDINSIVAVLYVAQALMWSYTMQENLQSKESTLFVLHHLTNVSCLQT